MEGMERGKGLNSAVVAVSFFLPGIDEAQKWARLTATDGGEEGWLNVKQMIFYGE
jgi:hypothetical protein